MALGVLSLPPRITYSLLCNTVSVRELGLWSEGVCVPDPCFRQAGKCMMLNKEACPVLYRCTCLLLHLKHKRFCSRNTICSFVPVFTISNEAGQSSDTASHLYSVGTRFESQTRHRLNWSSHFMSFFQAVLGRYFQIGHKHFFPVRFWFRVYDHPRI